MNTAENMIKPLEKTGELREAMTENMDMQSEVEEGKKVAMVSEISPESISSIKEEDIINRKQAETEIRGFAEQERKEKNNERLRMAELYQAKFDEMQGVVEEAKKNRNFLGKLFLDDEKTLTKIGQARKLVKMAIRDNKSLPDMHTIANKIGVIVSKVDISEFKEREGKKFSGGNSPANPK